MASIRKEISVRASVEQVWDAMRDIGALHTRLVPGFVVNTESDPGARVVTFANGRVVRERIISIDDEDRRFAWSATGVRLAHHKGAAQVIENLDGSARIVWTADLLPDTAATTVNEIMDQGMSAMKAALNQPAEM